LHCQRCRHERIETEEAAVGTSTGRETETRTSGESKARDLHDRSERHSDCQDILNTSRLIEIEVIPRFIVLDTNCFVNYLPIIYKLIKQNRFTVIIPLIGQ
jgi:hypothetical protein